MSLYQVSVLKKHLKLQEKEILQKAYKKYSKYFHNATIQENIKNSKEEEYQGIFLTELFVNILGYELSPKPNFNLVAEYKNQTNSRKADGAILKDGTALGVIELKGTKTKDLESIRRQAFDYKANQKGCVYVITSNFEKLRFYINDATEFLEFNLFTLTEIDFELLYLCLHKDNIINNLPLKIKEESITVEEKITKGFYTDYSIFKRELYRDLVKRNAKNLRSLIPSESSSETEQKDLEQLEKNVKRTLFKKSQKLIDRFLFIFFAEDRGLLPPNSTVKILDDWNKLKELDAIVPLYNRFKLYFDFLDKGRKGTGKKAEIYAYNGGLFKPDTILEAVIIDDELLAKHTRKLSNYDFESQVDVNILGHIFENSLNEIESVNAEIEGGDFDKQKSKRKKDGVFYTPKYITKYIVENTVGELCEEKKQELGFKEEEYFKSRKNRSKKKLLELVKLLDTYRDWLLQLTICDPACGSGAFLNQALDFLIKEHRYIDELKANVLGGGLVFADIETTILENNIYGVDLNEESVEIAKLSLWLRTAQPRRKLNDLSCNIKCGNSLIDSKTVAGDKAFNWQEQFPKVFKKGGFDVVIGNPPYVQTNDTFYKNYKTEKCGDLYAFFFEKGLEILKPDGLFSFITPSLFIKGMKYTTLREYLLNNSTIIEILDKGDKIFDDVQMPTAITILKNKKCINQDWNNYIPGNNLINKICLNTILIKDISKIMRGLEIGKDKVLNSLNDIQFLTGEDIFRYGIKKYSFINKSTYQKYKKNNFYFEGNRIIIRETGNRITTLFINDNITQQNRSLYSIKINIEEDFNPLYILSILNSLVIQFYYQTKFAANTDIFPKIRIGQVKEIPIKKISKKNQEPFIEKADIMLSINKDLQDITSKFQRTIQRKFESLEKLPKKIQDWYLLSYGDFVKELSKKKIKLSLSEEAEWEEYFNSEQQKAVALKTQIDQTDKEIDVMVYELYGLNEEEIAIVEDN